MTATRRADADAFSPQRPSGTGRLRRAVANAGQLIAGRLLGAVAGSAWLVLAARSLEPAAFGRFAVLLSVGTVLGVVSEAGLPLLVVDAVGRDPRRAPSVVRQVLRVRVGLTTAGGLVLTGLGFALGQPAAAAWFGISMVASAVITTIGPALRAAGSVVPESVAETGGRIAVLVAGVVLLRLSPTPAAVAGAYAVGLTSAAVALGYHARALVMGAAAPADHWPIPWRRAVPLGGAAAMVTLYNRVDLWLLAILATSRSAGLYAAAYRLFEGLVLPSAALGALLLPAAVAEPAGGRRTLALRYGLTSAALAGAGAVVVIAAAPQIVSSLFGQQFGAAVQALRLLAVASVPTAFLTTVSPLASVLDKRGCTHFILSASVASVAVNVALIPRWGATGAGLGMVLSQLLLATLFWRKTSRLHE